MSVAIIELLNKAVTTLTATSNKDVNVVQELPDHSDLWKIKEYKEQDHWFMKVGEYLIYYPLMLFCRNSKSLNNQCICLNRGS